MAMKGKEPVEVVCVQHYFLRDRQGNVHVDTLIDGQRWQHQVHSEAGFTAWARLVEGSELIGLSNRQCTCGLAVGDVLEHDGRIWDHPRFA